MPGRTWIEVVGEFDAEDDDGNAYGVVVRDTITESIGQDGTRRTQPAGSFRYSLRDGTRLNPKGPEVFEIVGSHKRIRKLG